ncbi:syntaxin Pep12p [Diutina catenulata]
MSFNNFSDLERVGSNKSSRYQDYPEFDSVSRAIDARLHHVSELLAEDSVDDGAVTDEFKKINARVKDLQTLLDTMERDKEDVEVVRYLRQKETLQIKLIREALGRFQRLRNKAAVDEETQNAVEPGSAGGQQQQQQVKITYEPINAEELEQQSLAIEQREQEIHRIHQDTLEINEIFENLSSIVNQQQYQVDNIEENLFNYSTDVRGAHTELRRAERYQRRSGGVMCYCLGILLILLGLIILVLMI